MLARTRPQRNTPGRAHSGESRRFRRSGVPRVADVTMVRAVPWETTVGGTHASGKLRVLGVLKNITFFSGIKDGVPLDASSDARSQPPTAAAKGGGPGCSCGRGNETTRQGESQHKVYVTRSLARKHRVTRRRELSRRSCVRADDQQTNLTVDPRSQTGFYSEKALADGGSGRRRVRLGSHRHDSRAELIAQGESVETRDIRAAYLGPLQRSAASTRGAASVKLQDLKNHWVPILNRLADPDKGPINTAAATIIEVLFSADEYDQLDIPQAPETGEEQQRRDHRK